MNVAQSDPLQGYGLDYAAQWPALVEPVVSAKNLDAPMSKNFVSGLLECERSVFPAFAECRRPLDFASEEGLPAKIEPVGDCLHALAPHHLPMRLVSVSQFSQVRLELGFGQCLFEQTIVAPVQGDRVIPDLRRYIDRAVQVPEPLTCEKLKLKGLMHRLLEIVVFTRTLRQQKKSRKSHPK